MLQDAIWIALITLAGGIVPLFSRRSDRALHLLVALASGVFLGVVFLHLLPEVAGLAEAQDQQNHLESAALEVGGAGSEAGEQAGHDHGDHGHGDGEEVDDGSHAGHDHGDAGASKPSVSAHSGAGHGHNHAGAGLWLCVLIGVLVLYVIENILFHSGGHVHHGHETHRHTTLGYASLIGLCVHALTAGIGLAAAHQQDGLAEPVFLSIISHKMAESFSLCSVFLLASFSTRRTLLLLVAFALVTPAGLFLGGWFMDGLGAEALRVSMALAAGTFLYVAIGDLLPEVFHNRKDTLLRLSLVAAGIAGTFFLLEAGG